MNLRTENLLHAHEADIIVFSHLRWHFVTQRPQHIINRLANNRKILFVEEPVSFEQNQKGMANFIQVHDNVAILQPYINFDNLAEELPPAIEDYISFLTAQKPPLLWFYSAAFHEMTSSIQHSLVIYDCMDELSAFKGASPALIDQEYKLIKKADLVFTGGRSLYEAKSKIADNVFCYPSAVEREHFEAALLEVTRVPNDIKAVPHPVVAYYGVIDERLNLQLLDEVSTLNPLVSFVMIGPVVKIDESELPRKTNIHYLGSKAYSELPAYLKGVDIAMMPFALNESTEFISPTKTLEYMAALKPIISTPVRDVEREYSDVVKIVHDAEEFTNAIRFYLNESKSHIDQRNKRYQEILDTKSWDKTVSAMEKNIREINLLKNQHYYETV